MSINVSSFFSTFKISSSALSAEKRQLSVTAENIANASTTRTAEGTAYRRKHLVREMISRRLPFSNELKNAGLRLRTSSGHHIAGSSYAPRGGNMTGSGEIRSEVKEVDEFKRIYDPSHPDADEEGIVTFPDINVVTEMLELISASRAYEANITVMNATKNLAQRSLEV